MQSHYKVHAGTCDTCATQLTMPAKFVLRQYVFTVIIILHGNGMHGATHFAVGRVSWRAVVDHIAMLKGST